MGAKVYDLGTGISFNIKTRLPNVDYTKLNDSNFIVGVVGAPSTMTSYTDWLNNHAAWAKGFTITKSYNKSTGVLTVGGASQMLYSLSKASGTSNLSYGIQQNLTVQA